MTPLPGADDGDRLLDGYARAQAILSDADEPPRALADATIAWAAQQGLEVSFARELDEAGVLAWRLLVYTDRGLVRHMPEDDETWRAMLARVDLLPPYAPRA